MTDGLKHLCDPNSVILCDKKVPDGTFNELAYAVNYELHVNWLRHELHLTVHEEMEVDSIHIGGAFA